MVSHWTNAGRLVLVSNGKRDLVDVAASDAALARSLDPSRGGKGGKSSGPPPPVEGGAAAVSGDGAPPPVDTYTRVRTHREAFRAKTEEVEYRARVGELVERKAYDQALADALSPLLSALDSLSARVGPAVAAEHDVRKCQNILDDAVAVIRQDIANTLRRMVQGNGAVRQ